MSHQLKLLAAAVCAVVGLNALAGEPAWGQLGLQLSDASVVWAPLTNVTASGSAILTTDDVDQLIAETDGAQSAVGLRFDANVTEHAWGSTTIKIDRIDLEAANDFFVTAGAAAGLTLTSDGQSSMITIRTSDACAYSNLVFVGANQDLEEHAPYDGGAIHQVGGSLQLDSCSFTSCVSRFSGGAVSAIGLTGDSLVTNCTFTANRSQPINGYGGAMYASKDVSAAGDVTLSVLGSSFIGNMAENGGALCAMTVVNDDEEPLSLVIDAGTVFSDNEAVYEGGAVITEGPVTVDGTNTLFRGNFAGLSGGAICVTGVLTDFLLPCASRLSAATFADNWVGTNWTWSVGGAVAILPAGCELTLDDYVLFTNNCAKTTSEDMPVYGGAVYTGAGVTNAFTRVNFVDNYVEAADGIWCYGGAVSVEGGQTAIDTCVFDCGPNARATCYGDAIDFNATEGMIVNSTFRRGQAEAISTYDGSLSVTNCVIVGNGLKDGGAGVDLYFEGTTAVSLDHTAYGSLVAENEGLVTETFTLAAREVAIYDGASLRLSGTGFNPVAGLGLVQTATDFDGFSYGSCAWGTSMGAFETNTVKLALNVTGTREYNGTATSNDTSFVFSIVVATNDLTAASYPDLVPGSAARLEDCFAFATPEWTFGPSTGTGPAGHYDSTNAVDSAWYLNASVTPVGATNAWLATLLDYRYQGDITPARDVAVYLTPDDYPWTGSAITPAPGGTRDLDDSPITVVISNKITGAVITPTVDVTYADNTEPSIGDANLGTGGKYIVEIKDGDFAGTVITNYFSITAYITEYYKNDTMSPTKVRDDSGWEAFFQSVTTNGWIAGSNAWAAITVPDGSCLDWQNSVTNRTVAKFGQDADATDNLTRLYVLYEKDVVGGTDSSDPQYPGDVIPDKFQKKIILATVNGDWTGSSNAYDQVRWVTLTNGDSQVSGVGKWDAVSGKCTLTTELVRFAGVDPRLGFENGAWVSEPVGSVVSATGGFPIYFFKPDRSGTPGRFDPSGPHHTLAALGSSLTALGAGADEYEQALAITDFAIDDGALAGVVEAQIRHVASGARVVGAELANTKIEVLGAETLDGEWFKVADVTTDGTGAWAVTRTRDTRSLSATRQATGDRTAVWNVSSAGLPKFFKTRLATED